MPSLDLTISPRAQDMQAMSQGQSPDDEDDIFSDGVRQLAYKSLLKGMPEMAADVVTFKVLDAEARTGRGIGTFIVRQPQGVIYIPAVVSENAIKPLDMFYCKRNDSFYPLTPDYLRLTTQGSLTDVGTPSDRPNTLHSDAPLLPYMGGGGARGLGGGRTVCASDDGDGAAPFRSLSSNDGHGQFSPMLPSALSRAPDVVKLAFARFLDSRRELRVRAVEVYGKAKLAEALAPVDGKEYRQHIGGGAHKVWTNRAAFDRGEKPRILKAAAYVERPAKRDVFLMTASTPVQEAKKELDPGETAAAFKSVAFKGYYLKDRRKKTDDVFAFSESTCHYEAPTAPGVYTVFTRNGPVVALVVPNPINFDDYRPNRGTANNYLVVFKDGRATTVSKLVAEARPGDSSTREIKKFLGDKLVDAPANQSYGCAVAIGPMSVRVTVPCNPWGVATTDNHFSFEAFGSRVVVDRKREDDSVYRTSEPNVMRLGGAFKWLKLERLGMSNSDSFDMSQDEVLRAAEYAMSRSGAKRVEVKTAGDGYVVGGAGRTLGRIHALYKVACDYNVSIAHAEAALDIADRHEPVTLWVKRADAAAPPADPNAAAPQQAPSPIDLAVAERMQVLQQQAAAVQQEMAGLQSVQARAQQIAGGGGAAAAPMGAAAMQGGPAPAPPPQGQPQQGAPPQGDPSQMQGQPPQGAPPQGDPPQMQGDPSQMQGDPSQMQGEEPPMAAMTEEPSPANIEAQINPQFMDSAAALSDDGVFDAAAVASLAQQKNLGALTQAYKPSLDKALDNLGRILLLFYIHGSDLKEQMGSDAYSDTEQKLRDTFKGLGDVMLNVDVQPGDIGTTATRNG